MSDESLPVLPLPDDAVDMVAREIAAQVAEHIQHQYPQAAQAVAWDSCKRSLSGLIRNNMARLGRAAERGGLAHEISNMRRDRYELAALRRKAKRKVQ